MSTLIHNIGELVTCDEEFTVRHAAALVVDGGRVVWIGDSAQEPAADDDLDVEGR